MTVSDSQHSDLVLEKLDELCESLLAQKNTTQESVKLVREVLNTINFDRIYERFLFESIAEVVGIPPDKWDRIKELAEIHTNKVFLERSHQTN